MKKNNILWLTLIELLVVVTIISTLTIVWFSSFWKSFERTNFNSKVKLILNEIDDLDSKIWSKTTDYEIYLIKNKNYYYYYENLFYKSKNQSLKINWFTGTVTTNDYIPNEYFLKYYQNSKLKSNYITSSTWSFVFNFEEKKNYKILSLINDEFLNTINLKYFNQYEYDNDYEILNIYDDSKSYTWVVISNYIWWKKIYKDLDWIIINSDLKIDFWDDRNFTTINLN